MAGGRRGYEFPQTATPPNSDGVFVVLTFSGGGTRAAALSFGVRLLYEDYTIDSFIRQGLTNYLPGALLLVADDGDYRAWSTGVRMSVRF